MSFQREDQECVDPFHQKHTHLDMIPMPWHLNVMWKRGSKAQKLGYNSLVVDRNNILACLIDHLNCSLFLQLKDGQWKRVPPLASLIRVNKKWKCESENMKVWNCQIMAGDRGSLHLLPWGECLENSKWIWTCTCFPRVKVWKTQNWCNLFGAGAAVILKIVSSYIPCYDPNIKPWFYYL